REDNLLRYVGSHDPGAILTEVNRLFPMTGAGEYFTIVMAQLDLRSQKVRYATAGHSGVCVHRRTGDLQWLAPPTLPLGFDSDCVYRSVETPFLPGDRLYLFSDGIYEVPNSKDELWGKERFAAALCRAADRTLSGALSTVVAEASQWSGRDGFPDDVAVVGIELKA
ncbi:MAG: serine/threonine-protein phosphatase, partial [Nitrospira sp.]|nr:serine/threonine-protein phosphatase [Nitrospira sp.]